MLGFYDYTVVMTYISLLVSMGGMMFTMNGYYKLAMTCLAVSGLCDMFDGKIARTKKNRTEDEKRFGIQIDSLCDIVCFGVAPALLCYRLGMNRLPGIIILMFYVLAGLIRLAYFNVMEEHRQDETDENRKYYQGLPITSMAIILPMVILGAPFFKTDFVLMLHVAVLATGMLFITNFKFSKPKNSTLVVLVTVVAAAVLWVLHR